MPERKETLHGVMVVVLGKGVFIAGESGVGKSEIALSLLQRHHQLVADDAVEIHRNEHDKLIGRAPALLKGFLEIRGLGILDVPKLFGENACADSHSLDLCITVSPMDANRLHSLDRLNGEYSQRRFLDIDIPNIILPITPARSPAVLLETAVANQQLRESGYSAVDAFIARHQAHMRDSS